MGFLLDRWNDIRGNLTWWLIVSLCGGGMTTVVSELIRFYRHLPFQWSFAIVVFVISSLVFALATLISAIQREKSEPIQTQGALISESSSSSEGDVDEFYRTYDNALLHEAEDTLRAHLQKYKTDSERERFLIRFSAMGAIVYIFDLGWAYIFRSQILALEELNRHSLTLDELRTFYDHAAHNHPDKYAGYPFASWLEFLSHGLFIMQEGLNVRLTVRGREFLKNMIHCGRSAKDRIY